MIYDMLTNYTRLKTKDIRLCSEVGHASCFMLHASDSLEVNHV